MNTVTQVSQIISERTWHSLDDVLSGGIRAATPEDAIEGVVPTRTVEPVSAEEIARLLKWASENGVAVSPRGGGSKLSWGNRPTAADVVLSLRKLDRVVEHAWDDMTVIVQAGCKFAALQSTLAEHGQHLALDV